MDRYIAGCGVTLPHKSARRRFPSIRILLPCRQTRHYGPVPRLLQANPPVNDSVPLRAGFVNCLSERAFLFPQSEP